MKKKNGAKEVLSVPENRLLKINQITHNDVEKYFVVGARGCPGTEDGCSGSDENLEARNWGHFLMASKYARARFAF